MTSNPRVIEIIVAVRNEAENIPLFVDAVRRLALPPETRVQTLFVEDSSSDGTREVLRQYAKTTNAVSYLFLKRGFGQAPAIAFGLSYSSADAMITMDVDGGHPLDIVPVMIREFLGGASIVQAVRRTLAERSLARDIGTWVFNRLFFMLTGINSAKQNVFFRLLSRSEAARLIRDNRWKHFLRTDFSRYGDGSVRYVEFEARERTVGESKYNLLRLIRFAITAVLTSISAGRIAVLTAILGVLSGLLLLASHLLLGGVVLVGVLLMLAEFWRLSSGDVFEQMEIEESSAGLKRQGGAL